MSAQLFSSSVSIEELVAQILMERRVTYTDQQILKWALLSREELDEQDRTLIDRVFYGVRHGLLRVVESID
ncbi:hypothetical protein [Allocoleopsis sp.]|uniref:hypothetical protein n=1 Tax=Allocoleopsis sp. TaxID=3088169 RepID=UPI002FD3DF61